MILQSPTYWLHVKHCQLHIDSVELIIENKVKQTPKAVNDQIRG